ncbi:MAG TPA: RsmB/NOP family class I SAM-dependent RNA methyltransferase [Stellaceae bacterium]|jgi:16S rRNA (cytosine967-C5)-methyltransferase
MTPGARISAAIDILSAVETAARPADGTAAEYFRRRRYIGAKDRATISSQVYAVLRHRSALDWWVAREGNGVGDRVRGRVIAALTLAEGHSADAVAHSFDGGRFRPAVLAPPEQTLAKRLAGRTLHHPAMPRAVANDLPEWLEPRLAAIYGDRLEDEMAALNSPAPMDLRVNAVKGDRDAALRALAAAGIHAEKTRWSPLGLRLKSRAPLAGLAAFKDGLIEVQDEASQLAAILAGVRPGMRVVDFCAGAGGKTLALAAAMKNRGKLVACDTAAWRLERAGQRLRRAGLTNVERRPLSTERDPWVKRHAKTFDRVFVDAPCLGIGTWRRNPDAKWRATEGDLAELVVRQHDILASAARLAKPGGRVIYATCSLLSEENENQAERFLDENPDFVAYPVAWAWEEIVGGACPGGSDMLRLTPARHGTDGFFVAIFERKPPAGGSSDEASLETDPAGDPQDEEQQ